MEDDETNGTGPRDETGRFPKGVSGNPGGRPKGLQRYVRELVGDDGRRIADYMLSVLEDESERTETRMQAASWLGDRGFGKAMQPTRDESETPRAIFVRSAFPDVGPNGIAASSVGADDVRAGGEGD